MAIDTAFFKHLEAVFPGRDIRAHKDEHLHHHGSSTVKYGRGAVLTIDLTNRCNLKCPICFANANQAGYVYEPSFEVVVKMLENLRSQRPVATPDCSVAANNSTDHRSDNARRTLAMPATTPLSSTRGYCTASSQTSAMSMSNPQRFGSATP